MYEPLTVCKRWSVTGRRGVAVMHSAFPRVGHLTFFGSVFGEEGLSLEPLIKGVRRHFPVALTPNFSDVTQPR
jgi:hypothetical protein